jgi:hypothetical protein
MRLGNCMKLYIWWNACIPMKRIAGLPEADRLMDTKNRLIRSARETFREAASSHPRNIWTALVTRDLRQCQNRTERAKRVLTEGEITEEERAPVLKKSGFR